MLLNKGALLFALFIISILFERLPPFSGIGPISMTDILVVVGVIIILKDRFEGVQVLLPSSIFRLSLFILLISFLAVITGLFTDFTQRTLIFSLSMTLKFLFINVFIYFAVKYRPEISKVDFILKSYVLIIFTIVALQYLGVPIWGGGEGSPAAFYNGRNELIIMFLPIALYVSYKNKPSLLFILISFTTLIMSRGRSGLLIFVLISTFILFQKKEYRKYIPFIVCLIGILIFLLPVEIYDAMYYRFVLSVGAESDESRGSTGIRTVLYENIYRILSDGYGYQNTLIGIGEGGFRNLSQSFYGMKEMGYESLQPHNTYLALLVNFGVISLISYLCFASLTLLNLFKKRNYIFMFVCLAIFFNLLFMDFVARYSIYLMVVLILYQNTNYPIVESKKEDT